MKIKLSDSGILNVLSKLFLLISIVWLSGCTYSVSFQDLHYDISSKHHEEAIVAIIDNKTLMRKVPITTGMVWRWDVMPGQMLMQTADIEFPQMFNDYKFSQSMDFKSFDDHGLVLVMTIPNYDFRNRHAFFTVNMAVYKHNKEKVLERRYTEEGFGQGAKMFWLGVFGTKSAIRQSSLDALKKIFQQIRFDLAELLATDLYEEEKGFGFDFYEEKKDIDFGF